MYIKYFKYNKDAISPTRNLDTDAGLDLYALNDVFIPVNSTISIPTGIAIDIPKGSVGKIEDRSSMAMKGIKSGGGVIDAGFSGEISIILNNLTNIAYTKDGIKGYQIKKGDKIAQILCYSVYLAQPIEVAQLWTSERGNKGLGSSGR